MGMACVLAVRQIHDPVVRQIDLLPSGIVESLHDRRLALPSRASLGEIREILRAMREVLLHRRGVTKGESPVVVQKSAEITGIKANVDKQGRDGEQYIL